ncbi:MAG: PP2C family protein-serine/threonine phosphatase [Acidimicrobiia bacterium]
MREGNEDSLYPTTSGSSAEAVVLMVADGMGGAVAGEVASRLAVEAASDAAPASSSTPEDRVLAANQAVIDATVKDPSTVGMGTTMTLVELDPSGKAHLAHVGDSRAYLLRDGEFTSITTDHTLVHELLELGRITPEEAETHPHRHLITRVLGLGPIAVDTSTFDLKEGDRLLLCTDGLTTMVSDFTIGGLIGAGQGVEPTAWALIEQANTAGGLDNTTVVVIDVQA